MSSEASSASLSCFLCSETLLNLKKLKVHLLLSHPRSHVCMFCVEKKSWSSEFPSQISYNEHYHKYHSGVIENRANKRTAEKRLILGRRLEFLLVVKARLFLSLSTFLHFLQ